MLLLASALFVGAALGVRHNAFVLIPISLITAAAAFAAKFADGGGVWSALLIATLSVIALQLAYFAVIMRSRPDAFDAVVEAPNLSIDHAQHGADVVYLSRHRLAKTR